MVKITIIITEAPYGTENAFGLLAAAGALATLHETSVIFAEAGVLNALKDQDTSNFIEFNKQYLSLPSHESKIKEYLELDIKFFVNAEEFENRGLTDQDLIRTVEKLTLDQIVEKILESDQILIV